MATLKTKVRKGLKLFVILLVFTMLALLFFSDPEPGKKFSLNIIKKLSYAFKKIDPFFLLFSLLCWVIHVLLDSCRISLLCQGVSDKWCDLKTSIEIILTGAFLAAVTPFQTGGFPVQLYLLKKAKISYGKGSLIILLRAIFYSIMMLVLFPFLFPILIKETEIKSINILSKYSIIVYSIIILIITFILIKPEIIKRLVYRLIKKKRKKGTKLIFKLFKEIEEMKEGFWFFVKKKKWHSIGSFFLTFITYIPYFFIASLLLKGIGIEESFFKIAFLQLVVIFFSFFSPTPGATGVTEGVFAVLFLGIIGRNLLGVFTILWRFFTFYLSALIGGILVLDVLKLGDLEIDRKRI
ncbi:MAG: flippase-like domain-containing protein [candidate division WOR-3 bacterium]